MDLSLATKIRKHRKLVDRSHHKTTKTSYTIKTACKRASKTSYVSFPSATSLDFELLRQQRRVVPPNVFLSLYYTIPILSCHPQTPSSDARPRGTSCTQQRHPQSSTAPSATQDLCAGKGNDSLCGAEHVHFAREARAKHYQPSTHSKYIRGAHREHSTRQHKSCSASVKHKWPPDDDHLCVHATRTCAGAGRLERTLRDTYHDRGFRRPRR